MSADANVTPSSRVAALAAEACASPPDGWRRGATWHSAAPGTPLPAAMAQADAANRRRRASGGRAVDLWPYTTVDFFRGTERVSLCYGDGVDLDAAALERACRALAVLRGCDREAVARYVATGEGDAP